MAVPIECDATKPAAVNMRYLVVFRQTLIQKCVIGLDQVEDTSIFPDNAFKQHFRFRTHCLTEVVIKIGIPSHVGRHGIQIDQVEPLRREIVDQRLRAIVRQHSSYLRFQQVRFVQFAARCHVQQFVIRNAAPQEERQS